jgi:hypothetical protein
VRPARFPEFAADLIRQSGGHMVKDVATLQDAGFTTAPYGLVITFPTGATAVVHTVGASETKEDQVIEGDAPVDPLPFPEGLGAEGKFKLSDVEAWLAAVLTSGGSREISGVDAWSTQKDGRPEHAGVTVQFHGGSRVYAAVAHLVGPGQSTDRQQWYSPAMEV